MTTLPRVINISRLTIGLNRPLSVIMPKNIIAKINMMTTLITDSKPLLKNLTKSLMPYPNSKAPILGIKIIPTTGLIFLQLKVQQLSR